MKRHSLAESAAITACLAILACATGATAQEFVSRTLTDAVYQGDGVIDLLKDVSGGDLSTYFDQNGGFLLLAADVNENNSGNESSDSLGVAIKQAQLSISTTDGDFTFTDFFTSTTAELRQRGSTVASDYYTLFGQSGSSTLTGAAGFNLSTYDDVLWLENIEFTGEILSAQLQITLLDTPTSQPTGAESFFDYSGGFEDFALLSSADAVLLEEADIGTATLAAGVTFKTATSLTTALGESAPTTPPAAPAPPWAFAAALGGLLLFQLSKPGHHAERT